MAKKTPKTYKVETVSTPGATTERIAQLIDGDKRQVPFAAVADTPDAYANIDSLQYVGRGFIYSDRGLPVPPNLDKYPGLGYKVQYFWRKK